MVARRGRTGTIGGKTSKDHCARSGEIICKGLPPGRTALARHGIRGRYASEKRGYESIQREARAAFPMISSFSLASLYSSIDIDLRWSTAISRNLISSLERGDFFEDLGLELERTAL